jgi:deoxyribodipyrimidine photolyase-related protein
VINVECKNKKYRMSKKAFLIFPHQLFENIEPLKGHDVFIIEEYLFFSQYKFHQQKIAYHRATMQQYKYYLEQQNIAVVYIEAINEIHKIKNCLQHLAAKKYTKVVLYNVVDFLLHKRITTACKLNNIAVEELETPMFINTTKNVENYFGEKQKYFQTDFYTQQRKSLDILIEDDGKPTGGKWTFDAENRLKYPKNKLAPLVTFAKADNFNKEAIGYVQQHFAKNYGAISDNFIYPTNFKDAKLWLQQFLENRFAEFGIYEDAIVNTEIILHHSVLTPMLNIGLLTPHYIIEQILQYSKSHNIAINNTEGILRQIIGWREFIRGIYTYKSVQERTTNFWKFKRKIPASFYNGTTGIVPVDDTIKKVLATGYCHHIERLMVLGNFMLLCEFDPNEVYQWFMELFIDAYDWVMVPNVYGMSQFADGGLMATKPYISGSNYIVKMSNYKKTNEANGWDVIWDALFWQFMHKQRSFFLSNPRLGMLIAMFDKMPAQKQQLHISIAEKYLEKLDVI